MSEQIEEFMERSYTQWPKEINHIMFIIVMEHELKDVVELLGLKLDESCKHNVFMESYIGMWKGKHVSVVKPPFDQVYHVQAVSSEPAVLCLQTAITKYSPDVVISAGTSGGVKRDLNLQLNLSIKDIVVAKSIQFFTRSIIIPDWQGYVQGKNYNLLHPKPLCQLLALKPVAIGTDNSFTNDNSQAKLHNIDCIEMEAAAEMRICHLMKVPFTAIKIISDVEMNDPLERKALFNDFFSHGIKNLALKVQQIIDNIDFISNYEI